MSILSGRYRHYKGSAYEVIAIALHSENKEKMVVYRALEDSADFPKGTVWVRPLSMFTQEVMVQGNKIPRFSKLDVL